MIHPLNIDVTKQNRSLDLAEDFGCEQFFLRLIHLVRLFNKGIGDFLGLKLRKLLVGIFQIVIRANIAKVSADSGKIPLSRLLRHCISCDRIGNRRGDHLEDRLLHIVTVKHRTALSIDDISLLIHYVVVCDNVLSALEVGILYIFLRTLNRVGQNFCINGGVVGKLQRFGNSQDSLTSEQTHKIVLQGQKEHGFSGIALTARTSSELIIDTSGLVSFGAENEQTARFSHLICLRLDLLFELAVKLGKDCSCFLYVFVVDLGCAGCHGNELLGYLLLTHLGLCHVFGVTAKHDVGTASRHVGRNRYCSKLTCLSYDLRFFFVVFCIEDGMRDSVTLEHGGKLLRLVDGNSTHKYRLSLCVTFLYLLNDSHILALDVFENNVVSIVSYHGLVGGNLHHVKTVYFAELVFLGHSRTGHTRQLSVHTEVVLESDGRQGSVFLLYVHSFLCLNCLMETV